MTKNKPNDFYLKVYDLVAEIPSGKVTNYGAIARYLGTGSASRMVGYALNNCSEYDLGFDVPAHRVVNRLGELTGRAYFSGDTMREKLEQEGIEFVEEYKVNLEKHFWDPFSKERS